MKKKMVFIGMCSLLEGGNPQKLAVLEIKQTKKKRGAYLINTVLFHLNCGEEKTLL